MQRTATFKSLITFKTLYECGNATHAAEALGITQSGVSRALAQLESQLQFKLFVRDKNRLIATPEADNLHRELRRMTGALLELEQTITSIREYGTTRIRVVATPALGPGYAPRLIAKALAGQDSSSLIFDIQSTDEAVRSVESGFSDIGFVTLPADTGALNVSKLIEAPAVCLLPKGHPLCAKKTIKAQDFAGEHLVVVTESSAAIQNVDTLLKQEGVRVLGRTESNIAAVPAFIANGMGVGVMNSVTAREALLQVRDIEVRPFKPTIRYEFALIYRPEWAESPTVARLLAAHQDKQV